MKRSILSILFSIFITVFSFAQKFNMISSTALKGVDYPKISSDHKVQFKLHAPTAQKVEFKGGDGVRDLKYKIQKEANGDWIIETESMPIGFHYYWFEVDGKPLNDPSVNTYFGYGKPTSGIEIPSEEDFFLTKNVPPGKIISDQFYSKILDEKREIAIYLPPNYGKKKLPVLYLYHGTGEDITGWDRQGFIQNILDNMIAEGKAKEMLVVMDFGVALIKEEENLPEGHDKIVLFTQNLEDVLVNELIPYIDRNYKTNNERAVAGLSRGSYQAMRIGANHPKLFSAIGSFSPVIYGGTEEDVFKELNLNNLHKKQYFFVGIGDLESDYFQGYHNQIIEKLKTNHHPIDIFTSKGTYHEWLTWRRCFYQFASNLFQ